MSKTKACLEYSNHYKKAYKYILEQSKGEIADKQAFLNEISAEMPQIPDLVSEFEEKIRESRKVRSLRKEYMRALETQDGFGGFNLYLGLEM